MFKAKLNDMNIRDYLFEAYNYLKEDIEAVLKYFPDIEKDKAMELIALDPTYNPNRNSVGTYGKWILNLYKQKRLKEEDFYKVSEYLKEFEEKKRWFKNKDIQQFKTLPDLRKALDEVEVGEVSDNKKQKDFHKELKKQDLDAQLIYEDDKWVCYIPNTYEASCKLSTDTEWCTGISSKGNTANYDWYTSKGPLYILIDKKNPKNKFQLHFETDSFMDESDSPIENLDNFIDSLPQDLSKRFRDLLIKKYWDKLTPSDSDDTILTHTMRKYLLDYIQGSTQYHGSAYMDGNTIAKIIEDPYDVLEYYGDDMDLQSFDLSQLKHTTPAIRDNLKDLGIKDEETFFKLLDDYYNKQEFTAYSHYDEQIIDAVVYAARSAWRDGSIDECLNSIEKALIECFPDEYKDKLKVNLDEQTLTATMTVEDWKKFIQQGRINFIEDPYYNYEDPDDLDALFGYYIITNLKVSEPYAGWSGFDENNYVDYLDDQLNEVIDEKEQEFGHQMDLFTDYDENGEPI